MPYFWVMLKKILLKVVDHRNCGQFFPGLQFDVVATLILTVFSAGLFTGEKARGMVRAVIHSK